VTTRQKFIIAALAIADIAVILTIALLYVHYTVYQPLRQPVSSAFESHNCRWQAAVLMAQARLSGTANITSDDTLRFEIIYPLVQKQQADQAAQAIWYAFDVAWALQSQYRSCATFTRVEVVVTARREHQETDEASFSAAASVADLVAFYTGSLSEETFIERVSYSVSGLQ
jgi:hypothetical protein